MKQTSFPNLQLHQTQLVCNLRTPSRTNPGSSQPIEDLSSEVFSCFIAIKARCKAQRLTWVSWRWGGLTLSILWNRTAWEESLRQLETMQHPLPHSKSAPLLSADHSPLCFTDLSSYNFSLHQSSCGLPRDSLYHSPLASASTVHCPVCSVSTQPSSAHVIFLGQAMSLVSDQSADWLHCVTLTSLTPSVVAREISDCSPWVPCSRFHRQSKLLDGCA